MYIQVHYKTFIKAEFIYVQFNALNNLTLRKQWKFNIPLRLWSNQLTVWKPAHSNFEKQVQREWWATVRKTDQNTYGPLNFAFRCSVQWVGFDRRNLP